MTPETLADRARAAHRIRDMAADVTKLPTSMTSTPLQVEPAFEEELSTEEEE